MKKFVTSYGPYILLAVMLLALIPGIANRISHENDNRNVVISFLYNDVRSKLSAQDIDEQIAEYQAMGVNTVSVTEDDINAMVSRGEITAIKYNALCQKYDTDSVEMSKLVAASCPGVSPTSYIIIAKDDVTKSKLRNALPRRYSDRDFGFAGTFRDMDIYVFYDGRKNLWDFAITYDENQIREFTDRGFNIALIHKVKNYANTEYLEDIDRIVKKYDIEYMNLKEDAYEYDEEDINKDNYKKLSRVINDNNMTLVVTENTDQLSNQKCLGYDYIFNETMGEDGSKKVIRAYETHDDSQADESFYEYRATQYLNSTIDRNIRFITVTQIAADGIPYTKCAENTQKAVKLYKDRIEGLGFLVNQGITPNDYHANTRLNAAICAVIMVLCLLLMWQMITGKKNFMLFLISLIVAFAGFLISFIMPKALLALYPSLFCVIQSCFAITVVLYYLKTMQKKSNIAVLTPVSLVLVLGVLLLGSMAMGCMLSGINYYINNDIFRGIKLSLLVPVFYTAVLFYFMFVKNDKTSIIKDVKMVLVSDIKVYWVLIGIVIVAIGAYYIIRSGNVNKISSLEHAMRNTITEIFPARPRTKEFLIGYPALILLIYYMKKSDFILIKWLLAIATSILAASITNSFCHVFTDFSVIVNRTLNGLLIGIFVSAIAFVANIVLIGILKKISYKLKDTEMK